MYVEATNARQGFFSDTLLVSKRLMAVAKPGVCFLNFWYHMYGSDVGDLYTWKRSSGAFSWQYPLLFDRSGNQGNKWLNATVDLYTTAYVNSVFDVTIDASFIFSASSDIAIDDISFSPGCSFTGKQGHPIFPEPVHG